MAGSVGFWAGCSVGFSVCFSVAFSVGAWAAAVVDSVTFDVVVSVTVAAAFEVSALVVAAVVTELSLPAFVAASLSLEASPDTSPSPDFSVASDSFVPVSLPVPVSFEALSLSFVGSVSLVLPPLFVVLSCFVDSASVLVDVSAGSSLPTGRVSTGANVLLQAAVIRVTDVMTAAVIRRLKLCLLISNTFFLSHYVYFLL